MQHKTTQHKHRTIYAIKKAIRLLKTKEMIKDYIIIMIKYDYVPSVPNIHSDWL